MAVGSGHETNARPSSEGVASSATTNASREVGHHGGAMDVFVLTDHEAGEADYVMGVFSTLELAKASTGWSRRPVNWTVEHIGRDAEEVWRDGPFAIRRHAVE